MKQIKAIVITAFLTIFTIGAVLYTSCKKDHCKTLACQHAGSCNDGFCLCPTGYTGTYCEVANLSGIALHNRTFTKVYINVNGVDNTVDSGTTVTITGGFGDTLKLSPTTHGMYGINVPMDALKVPFPTSGTVTQNLDVSGKYFFLKVINTTGEPDITQVHVNYQQRDETLDVVTIPNNGQVQNIGYYRAYTDTHIDLERTPLHWDFDTLNLHDTVVNQSYTAIPL